MTVQKITAEELSVSEAELALRMQIPRSEDLSKAVTAAEKILSVSNCKMAAVKVDVTLTCDSVWLSDIEIKSQSLKKYLSSSKEAYVFGVTLGMGVDRYLLGLSKISVSEHFTADAAASAVAEALADKAQEKLCGVSKCRFSPGYGDLPLEVQPLILKKLEAEKTLGIVLTETLLMKPQKSITAIVGI